MLDTRPEESEARSWFYVVTWSLIIFVTVPFARAIQAYVSTTWGRDYFIYGVFLAITAFLLYSFRTLKIRRQHATLGGYLWLLGITAIFVIYTIHLRSIPEEAMHFVQYGILSLLVYRALTHRISDNGIYIVAALVTFAVGITDEALQWLVPKRVWGLEDIWLDAVAAVLALLAVAKGLRPALISGRPSSRTMQLLCRAGLVVIVLLGTSLLNTPQTISWYVGKLPGLQFVINNASVMSEYGYRYEDDETGVFRSRLPPHQLMLTDRQRATDAAAQLDRLPTQDDYAEFLSLYTPFNDPFLHEARVHLNRRDYYLTSAKMYQENDLAEFRRRMTIAYFENRIMEKYFPETLTRSSFLLPVETVSQLRENAITDSGYESAVSKDLLTRVSRQQVFWVAILLSCSLLAMDFWLTRRRQS